MLLFFSLLTIYSGGLWLIDLVFFAIMAITFFTAKKEAKEKALAIYQVSPIVLTVLAFFFWILSMLIRHWEI